MFEAKVVSPSFEMKILHKQTKNPLQPTEGWNRHFFGSYHQSVHSDTLESGRAVFISPEWLCKGFRALNMIIYVASRIISHVKVMY